MLNIEEQKKIADEIINKLRAVDPYCIVAGGAPRDWYFGNPANDLDIYIWQQHKTQHACIYQLECAGFEVFERGFKDDHRHMYETNAAIKAVYNVQGFGMQVQIISLNTSTFNVIDTFPFSICKAWYTPERGVKLEKDFKITLKTGYIYNTNKLYCDADSYVKKIKERFKGKFNFAKDKQEAMERFIEKL